MLCVLMNDKNMLLSNNILNISSIQQYEVFGYEYWIVTVLYLENNYMECTACYI